MWCVCVEGGGGGEECAFVCLLAYVWVGGGGCKGGWYACEHDEDWVQNEHCCVQAFSKAGRSMETLYQVPIYVYKST